MVDGRADGKGLGGKFAARQVFRGSGVLVWITRAEIIEAWLETGFVFQ